MLLSENIIFILDSYKDLHPVMLPEGTTKSSSYLESRIGAEYPYTQYFGGQYIINKWLAGQTVTREKIDQAAPILEEHFKFNGKVWNRKYWDYIVDECGGRLPLEIKAVREGVRVPVSNILMRVDNTDEHSAWLPGAMETVLQQVWYPSTTATRSNIILEIIRKYFRETVDDDLQWLADYYLHDFGQRAATCMEAAGIGGAGVLINSKGTDTKMGMAYAMDFYGASHIDLAYSVPASEHSIATSLGREGEYAVAKRLLQLFPNGILSHVSDSYNITDAIHAYNNDPEFRTAILARQGKFVARPDSPRFKSDTPQAQILWITQQWEKGYGAKINSKGYKDLDPHVGTIYGDSLTIENIQDILETLKKNGYSALASVMGCGGYLIQKLNRDTQRQAFKCSAQQRNGEWIDIYKEPLDASKASKRGRLKLVKDSSGAYETVQQSDARKDELVTVFRNGESLNQVNFKQVRENSLESIVY